MDSLLRKLRRSDGLTEYDAVIQDQLSEGVVEKAPTAVAGIEFYIPHRAIVREMAETTKLRVVYDASARAFESAPSLNECLHAGPPLQNQLWSVLTRNRFHAVAVAGDIRKAFLQVRIRETERDALRFHWLTDAHSKKVQTLRFTRALFGLAPSPFLLGGVIEQHLESWRDRLPECVREVRKSLYVDDLISGKSTVSEAKQLKSETIEIFADATFTLHKWHSNVPELESNEITKDEGEQSFAKEQLGVPAKGECKLLGLPWNKTADTLSVSFPVRPAELTKRGILANLAKVYDPLGLVSPVTLGGKLVFREACNLKIAWDAPLPNEISAQWVKWERGLPEFVSTQRSLATYQEPISAVQLHAFGDASGRGVGAAVYAVVTQDSGVTQGLVAAKSRLAKQGLTIPRLELVAGHMAVNLAVNVRRALEGFPLQSNIQCWLDSSVALYWIRGQGEYRQFVANRIMKIQNHPDTLWRHVPTAENPADLCSRSGRVTEAELWWRGPEWLSDPTRWPPDIITEPCQETRAERKVTKELYACAIDVRDEFDGVLEKFDLSKATRVCAWISRFTYNSRHPTNKISGPLTTDEISKQTVFWVKRAQREGLSNPSFPEDKHQLNLQLNADGVLECRGRIQGEYPVYLPDSVLYTAKCAQRAHVTTLHGGVSLTMAKVREKLWVPRLRKLTKQIIKRCWGCKRFQAVAVKSPPPGLLPRDRTEGNTPYSVIGVDFAGPLKYRVRPKTEGKAYVVLYSCSLTRGIYMELLQSLETSEFTRSMKRLIARRGRPTKVYSDNGKTFVAAAKWLKAVREDEKFNDFLANNVITWQFNLSRAPWWGGQFERLIGLVKSALYKTIGHGLLTWSELGEVLLDIEISLNNRPLSYVEEDIQFPTLTPNSLLFANSNIIPELDPCHLEDKDLRKRARYLLKCKDAMWRRWSTEYLRALRERHRLKHQAVDNSLAQGDVVIIKEDQRNRNSWKLGIVDQLIVGRDGIVRAAKLRAGKSFLERAVQQLYPLELSCDRTTVATPVPLNPDAPRFRPRRDAAVAANVRLHDLARDEQGL